MDTETKAIAIGDDRKRLQHHLRQARHDLTSAAIKAFGRGHFDFDNKRLVSDDRTWAMVWQVRKDPTAPIAYLNQQTSVGYVSIVDIGP